jgi:hypothetical protein
VKKYISRLAMTNPKITGFHTINVKTDTYQAVKKYAGSLQAKHGGRITEDITIKTLLMQGRKERV